MAEENPTDRLVDEANPNVIAARAAAAKIEEYGSIDKWPVLNLLPTQYPACVCGHLRVDHKFLSTDRRGCKKRSCECKTFTANVSKRS